MSISCSYPHPHPNAPQVQDAILHNKRIFEQRLVAEQRALLKRAWQAWLAVRLRSASKAALLRKACNRISRGLLSRSFYTWKDELHLVDKTLAMRRKVGGGGRLVWYSDIAAG